MPSSGWMRIVRWSRCGRSISLPRNTLNGTLRNFSVISVDFLAKHLPVRRKKGTSAQRQLSMSTRNAANVSMFESSATPGSDR